MSRILILLFIPFLLNTQNVNLNTKNGFSHYEFGTSAQEYNDLSLEIDEGDTKLYSLKGNIKIDDFDLDYVRLTFLKNKLSAISLQTKNSSGSKFLEYLKHKYGEPNKITEKNTNEWYNTDINLIYTAYKKDAVIDFYSKKVR